MAHCEYMQIIMCIYLGKFNNNGQRDRHMEIINSRIFSPAERDYI